MLPELKIVYVDEPRNRKEIPDLLLSNLPEGYHFKRMAHMRNRKLRLTYVKIEEPDAEIL